MTKDILVREALDADVDGIVSIYNDVLATTSAIWSDQPVSVPDRQRWLADKRAASEPVVVATDASGVLGFAAGDPFEPCPATSERSNTRSTSVPTPGGEGSAPWYWQHWRTGLARSGSM